MHSNVTSKDVSWLHFSWPALYSLHALLLSFFVLFYSYSWDQYFVLLEDIYWLTL